jgi:hypothetical protein
MPLLQGQRRRLHASLRRADGAGRLRRLRQDQHAGVRSAAHDRVVPARSGEQSLESGVQPRWLEWRLGRRRGRGHRAHRAGQRRRRVDPSARLQLRPVRDEGYARSLPGARAEAQRWRAGGARVREPQRSRWQGRLRPRGSEGAGGKLPAAARPVGHARAAPTSGSRSRPATCAARTPTPSVPRPSARPPRCARAWGMRWRRPRRRWTAQPSTNTS